MKYYVRLQHQNTIIVRVVHIENPTRSDDSRIKRFFNNLLWEVLDIVQFDGSIEDAGQAIYLD